MDHLDSNLDDYKGLRSAIAELQVGDLRELHPRGMHGEARVKGAHAVGREEG